MGDPAADEEQWEVPEAEERSDHQAREDRAETLLPARGEKRHPPGLLPEGDEQGNENDLQQIARKELRKIAGERLQNARALDRGTADEEEQWRPEESQHVPLRTCAPREV